MRTLSVQERTNRLCVLLGMLGGLLLLRAIDPTAIGRWLPVHKSCGAITGLPCIFCGVTRGLHCLLNGDLARAMYFNWLVFPLMAAASLAFVLLSFETSWGRSILRWRHGVQITPYRIAACISGLLALWILQAWLAVSQHKTELLNSHGLLYGLLVHAH